MTIIKKYFKYLVILIALIVFGQQCAEYDVNLDERFDFQSSEESFRLNPPTDYKSIRRFVIAVDMSNSMVSGPCPQDVDAKLMFDKISSPLVPFDPNKKVGDPKDHRLSAIDCVVDNMLPINRDSIVENFQNVIINGYTFFMALFKTPLGMDAEGSRFDVIEKWIEQANERLSRTKVTDAEFIIYPITGGLRQSQILSEMPIQPKFLHYRDPKLKQNLEKLKQIQQQDIVHLENAQDLVRFHKTKMGTTSFGDQVDELYNLISKDMQKLYKEGLLHKAEYSFVYISDGVFNPNSEHIKSVLDNFPTCADYGVSSKQCDNLHTSLNEKLKRAWGIPENNRLEIVDIELGTISTLPNYYRTSGIDMNFVHIRPDRFQELHSHIEKTDLSKLHDMAESVGRTINMWELNNSDIPFELVEVPPETESYEVTHSYVLNTNVHYDSELGIQADSDGDGLSDAKEKELGTDPQNPRTHEICLDSFLSNNAYKDSCARPENAIALACDIQLDSDGDGLNECEEIILGTKPLDFDTDGDTIPDSLEWLYGYNPLESDRDLDRNSDGTVNIINFGKGLDPMILIDKVSPNHMANYQFNLLKQENQLNEFGQTIQLANYSLNVFHIPTAPTVLSKDKSVVYYVRNVGEGANKYAFSNNQKVVSGTIEPGTNNILILMRLKKLGENKKFYWQIQRVNIPVGVKFGNGTLDLSALEQLQALDFN